MARLHYKGASIDTGGAPQPGAIRYAIVPRPGAQGPILGSGSTYPKVCNPDQMAELCWRKKRYRFQLDWVQPWISVAEEGRVGTLEVIVESVAADEQALQNSGASIFANISATGTIDVIDEFGGVVSSSSLDGSASVNIAEVTQFPPNGAESVGEENYIYDPVADLWLPRVELFCSPTGGNSLESILNYPIVAPGDPGSPWLGDYTAEPFSATFEGEALEMTMVYLTARPVSSITLTVTPILWWEYRDADGNNPIWDALTGAQLLPLLP